MWNTIIDEAPSAQILSAWIAKDELRTDPPCAPAATPTSPANARTEGYDRLVKQVKRVCLRIPQHRNSARRIRFHCTGKQRAATQTSG